MGRRRHGNGEGARAIPAVVKVVEALSTSLWALPVAGIGAAVALSLLVKRIDTHLAPEATAWYLFRGGPDGARDVLSTVAASIMTFTGVVFSITILVLQLASQQFSPRVLRTFLSDRGTQVPLAVFIGTFVYALLTLRSVRGASDGIEEYVPSLSIWLAVVLAIACVATFVFFIHHISQSIRAVNVLGRIGDETRASLDTLFPEGLGEEPDPENGRRPEGDPVLVVLHRGVSGVLTAVAEDRVWDAATACEVSVVLVPMPGDFVAAGSPLFEVWGDPDGLDPDALADALTIGRERTTFQDPAFGFRGIVDIAERALSPGVNDPTTAVQALDELHDLLRRLATRRFPDPARLDDRGRIRVVLPRPDFDAYVRLALDEIRHYGEGSVQVARRLRLLVEDVLRLAPPGRRDELRRQLQALDASVSQEGPRLAAAPGIARTASAQGHGP